MLCRKCCVFCHEHAHCVLFCVLSIRCCVMRSVVCGLSIAYRVSCIACCVLFTVCVSCIRIVYLVWCIV